MPEWLMADHWIAIGHSGARQLSQAHVIWLTAFVSALTAGIVTLAIEYAAKPWLDARKHRILELSKLRRDAVRDLRRANYLCDQVREYRDHLNWEELRIKFTAQLKELEPLLERLAEQTPDILAKRLQNALLVPSAQVAACASLTAQKDATLADMWSVFDPAAIGLKDLYGYLTTERWRWLKRRKLAAELELSATETLWRHVAEQPVRASGAAAPVSREQRL